MLNISEKSLKGKIVEMDFRSFDHSRPFSSKGAGRRMLLICFLVFIACMFLPWTQNVQGSGKLTTLYPSERPQTVHSTIAGRIEEWYVREGQLVDSGQVIVRLSEIKAEYFDPRMLERQMEQLDAQKSTVNASQEKLIALDMQITNLKENQRLKENQNKNKLEQASLKIKTDSINVQAAKIDYNIAKEQSLRADKLFADGLLSKVDYERRQLKVQETAAKLNDSENKLLISRNEAINVKIEQNNIKAEYGEKVAKAFSDRRTAESSLFSAKGSTARMEISTENIRLRAGFYEVVAPQKGYIVNALAEGVGETVKEGQSIVSIMPLKYTPAVELFVRPMDVPLLNPGEHVRVVFDGWPAFVFSGWPGSSWGTYGGTVFAIDRVSNEKNLFRVLVKPDNTDGHGWPDRLRVGAGAKGMVMLHDVRLGYEMWRQINGFPPEFYLSDSEEFKKQEKEDKENAKDLKGLKKKK